MSLPCVSVVTPSFNQGRFIEATLRSVLDQGYPHLDYIVCDGGSTDQTVNVLKRYEGRVRWVSEKDNGQADAVNKGFSMARGEIFGWINSDDVYHPGVLDRVGSFFKDHPEVDWIYGRGDHIDMNGRFLGAYPTGPLGPDGLANSCVLCQPTVFFRSRLFSKVGPLDVTLRYCMDYDYWIRAVAHFRPFFLDFSFAGSRLHENTKTLAERAQAHREIIYLLKKRYDHVPLVMIGGAACHDLANWLRTPYPLTYSRTWFIDGLRHWGWRPRTFFFLIVLPLVVGCRYLSWNHSLPRMGELSDAWRRLVLLFRRSTGVFEKIR